MKTHTIRNKKGPIPILSFTEEFLERILSYRSESFSLTFALFRRQYLGLTGKRIVLDFDQYETISTHFKIGDVSISPYNNLDSTVYEMIMTFHRGFLNNSLMDLETALDIAEEFNIILEEHYDIKFPRG